MGWVKLDDGFHLNPKITGLSDRAFRVYVEMLAWSSCNLTDGVLPARIVRDIRATDARTLRRERVHPRAELARAGLWEEQADGSYLIHDYLEYNPSREQVKERRQAAKERQARRRDDGSGRFVSRRDSRRDNSDVTPPRPDPYRERESLSSASRRDNDADENPMDALMRYASARIVHHDNEGRS